MSQRAQTFRRQSSPEAPEPDFFSDYEQDAIEVKLKALRRFLQKYCHFHTYDLIGREASPQTIILTFKDGNIAHAIQQLRPVERHFTKRRLILASNDYLVMKERPSKCYSRITQYVSEAIIKQISGPRTGGNGGSLSDSDSAVSLSPNPRTTNQQDLPVARKKKKPRHHITSPSDKSLSHHPSPSSNLARRPTKSRSRAHRRRQETRSTTFTTDTPRLQTEVPSAAAQQLITTFREHTTQPGHYILRSVSNRTVRQTLAYFQDHCPYVANAVARPNGDNATSTITYTVVSDLVALALAPRPSEWTTK